MFVLVLGCEFHGPDSYPVSLLLLKPPGVWRWELGDVRIPPSGGQKGGGAAGGRPMGLCGLVGGPPSVPVTAGWRQSPPLRECCLPRTSGEPAASACGGLAPDRPHQPGLEPGAGRTQPKCYPLAHSQPFLEIRENKSLARSVL